MPYYVNAIPRRSPVNRSCPPPIDRRWRQPICGWQPEAPTHGGQDGYKAVVSRAEAPRARRMKEPRPSREEWKMALAVEIASRSNCVKTHVGAILLHGDRIRAVGYNGTIEGYDDCFSGGCPRCRDESIHGGQQLDRCVCVHAEENALVSAARFGIEVGGAECYVTHEPCLSCTKLLIQAHVGKVVYLVDYVYPEGVDPSGQLLDHGASRVTMRNASQAREGGTKFQNFDEALAASCEEAVRSRVKAWEKRLEDMKLQAREYARALGVLSASGKRPGPLVGPAQSPKSKREARRAVRHRS